MTKTEFVFLLIGIAVATVFWLCLSAIKRKDLFKIFVNKNGLQNGLIIGVFAIMVLSLVFNFGVVSSDDEVVAAIFSLIGSSAFSYLLTKRYSKITYEDELRKVAITAYRHNKNLLTKIKYEIDIIDRIFSQNVCDNNHLGNSCEYTHTLYRMRDSLIGFKRDTEENINDWSDIIPKEIDAINTVSDTQKKINLLAYDRADMEDEIDEELLEKENAELKERLNKHQKILDANPRLKIILENENKLSEEMEDLITREIDARKSKSMKSPNHYDPMKVYYDTVLGKTQEG